MITVVIEACQHIEVFAQQEVTRQDEASVRIVVLNILNLRVANGDYTVDGLLVGYFDRVVAVNEREVESRG